MKRTPISQMGGKGLFVKEIEKALIDGEIDLEPPVAPSSRIVQPIDHRGRLGIGRGGRNVLRSMLKLMVILKLKTCFQKNG